MKNCVEFPKRYADGSDNSGLSSKVIVIKTVCFTQGSYKMDLAKRQDGTHEV